MGIKGSHKGVSPSYTKPTYPNSESNPQDQHNNMISDVLRVKPLLRQPTAIFPEPPIQPSKPDFTNGSDDGQQQNATARGLEKNKNVHIARAVPVSHHSRVDLYHVPAKFNVDINS